MTRLVLVLFVLFAGPASAQKSNKPEAQAHLARAKSHFDLQDYAAAEAALKDAYLIDPKPEILYAIAQTQRRRGNCEQAIISYNNFLRTKPKPDQAKLATEHIADCEAELVDTRKKAAAAKQASAQKPAPPSTPVPTSVPLPTAPPTGVRWTRNWLGHGLVVAGAITAVGGAIIARGGQSRIDELNNTEFYDDFLARSRDIASAESTRTTGFVLVGAGTALVVAGVIAYVVRSPGGEKMSVAIGPHTASVGWAW